MEVPRPSVFFSVLFFSRRVEVYPPFYVQLFNYLWRLNINILFYSPCPPPTFPHFPKGLRKQSIFPELAPVLHLLRCPLSMNEVSQFAGRERELNRHHKKRSEKVTLIHEWSLVCHRRAPTVRAKASPLNTEIKRSHLLPPLCPTARMVLQRADLLLSAAMKSSAGFGKRVARTRRRKFRHRGCIRWNNSVIHTSDPLSYLVCLLLSFSLWCFVAAPHHSSRQFSLLADAAEGLPRLETSCAADTLPPCVVRKSSDHS